MRAIRCCLVGTLIWLMIPTAVAQQGHPLVGVWSGDWGPTPKERHPVLIEMSWENTTLSGTINPGEPDAAPIKVGRLDSSNWTVHLEAEFIDANKTPVRVIVDGQLEDLGSPKRTLSGTWTRGNVKGTFKVTRE